MEKGVHSVPSLTTDHLKVFTAGCFGIEVITLLICLERVMLLCSMKVVKTPADNVEIFQVTDILYRASHCPASTLHNREM